jgi:NTE family protein
MTPNNTAFVFSGGGARAAYQVGVLQAVAELAPELEIPIVTGVSAGAINSAFLAAHPGPFPKAVEDLRQEWERLTVDRVYGIQPLRIGRALLRWGFNMLLRRHTAPTAFKGLMSTEPLRQFLSECMDFGGIGRNIAAGRLRAAALSATCYNTGQTVTFVQGGAEVPLWERHMRLAVRSVITVDHLLASAAIPLVFPAVRLGVAFYGDGSVRQTAPLSPAIHLGARRILAVAMRAREPAVACAPDDADYPLAAEVFGLLLHSVFIDSLDADVERLRRINSLLHAVPAEHAPEGVRPIDLFVLRPSRDLGELARGCRASLPPLLQLAVRSIGGERAKSADFQSYLMFQPEYTGRLIELGYRDAKQRATGIVQFLHGRAVGR